MKQPKIIDHENKIVFYNKEDITQEITDYWAYKPPYYPIAEYRGEEHKARIEKINLEKENRENKEKDKDQKIEDLEARIIELEKNN